MQAKTVPLCLRSASFKVAVDTRGSFDFSRSSKSPSILVSCNELVEVYAWYSKILAFAMSVSAHQRVVVEDTVQVITILPPTQTATHSPAGSRFAE